jgi:hypothetical protein
MRAHLWIDSPGAPRFMSKMTSFAEMSRRESVKAQKIADKLDPALDRARNEAFEVARPSVLCHYTDWKGLQGILNSNEIWLFGFADQQTDRFELRHADQSILEVSAALATDQSLLISERELLDDFTRNWSSESLAKRAADRFFLACFSESPSNEELWRGPFGRDCSGYAIEFELLAEEPVVPHAGIGLFKVRYDQSGAAELVGQVFRKYFAVYRSTVPVALLGHDAPRGILHRALRVAAATAAALTKSPEHEGDHEWRAVALVTDFAAVERSGVPRPHVRMPLRAQRDKKPVIRAIHVGSAALPTAEDDVEALLESVGFRAQERPTITRSKVLRGPQ